MSKIYNNKKIKAKLSNDFSNSFKALIKNCLKL